MSYLATKYINNKTLRYGLIDGFYELVSMLVSLLLSSRTTIASDQVKNAFRDRVDRFRQIKQELDPTQRFLNRYFKALLEPDSDIELYQSNL